MTTTRIIGEKMLKVFDSKNIDAVTLLATFSDHTELIYKMEEFATSAQPEQYGGNVGGQ